MRNRRRQRVVVTAALLLVLAPLTVLLLFGRNAGIGAGVAVITGALGVPLFIGMVLWWLDRGGVLFLACLTLLAAAVAVAASGVINGQLVMLVGGGAFAVPTCVGLVAARTSLGRHPWEAALTALALAAVGAAVAVNAPELLPHVGAVVGSGLLLLASLILWPAEQTG